MQFDRVDLGLVDFAQAQSLQKSVFEEVKNTASLGTLIFCQHYPVITLGRSSDKKNILASEQELTKRGIKIYEIERGGDITYHGPGQLIVYPIFNLRYLKKDIHFFLRYLEEVVIELFSDFGVQGIRIPGLTGVWIDKQKIASIGIAIRQWITFHGLSLNIKKDDLDNFRFIRPCGMDIKITSLETILGRSVQVDDIKERLSSKFRDVQGCLSTA
jgi:lipoate-protein ligase B